ncbi:hypothetical protein LZ32DRAFT_147167 [Colletotrichum eremochloae]|nr:hypothetical protein LZ32DRAFT_147167 [Colletotrichum eremochloae]
MPYRRHLCDATVEMVKGSSGFCIPQAKLFGGFVSSGTILESCGIAGGGEEHAFPALGRKGGERKRGGRCDSSQAPWDQSFSLCRPNNNPKLSRGTPSPFAFGVSALETNNKRCSLSTCMSRLAARLLASPSGACRVALTPASRLTITGRHDDEDASTKCAKALEPHPLLSALPFRNQQCSPVVRLPLWHVRRPTVGPNAHPSTIVPGALLPAYLVDPAFARP